MSVTVDCGEGKHDLCIGYSDTHYLIPQLAGERFKCRCPCHERDETGDAEEEDVQVRP